VCLSGITYFCPENFVAKWRKMAKKSATKSVKNNNNKSTRRAQAKMSQRVIRDSNPDFRINPNADPDICWIAPKMLIHCLVRISHFPKFRKNRRVTV